MEKLHQKTKKTQVKSVSQSLPGQTATMDSNSPLHTAQKKQNEAIEKSPYMTRQEVSVERVLQPVQKKNVTGMPDNVKAKMEGSFNTDFSNVRVHASSSKAPEVGALAYTQGTDIHFAPGQFSPESSSGQSLLGHELAHVVQQGEGRVQPTTEINGLPVNDNPALEDEADRMGNKI